LPQDLTKPKQVQTLSSGTSIQPEKLILKEQSKKKPKPKTPNRDSFSLQKKNYEKVNFPTTSYNVYNEAAVFVFIFFKC
jgi:hypothetical protein